MRPTPGTHVAGDWETERPHQVQGGKGYLVPREAEEIEREKFRGKGVAVHQGHAAWEERAAPAESCDDPG